ncbi:MAG: hypothetical protein QF738_03855, partial [Rhodospirillales bacterium]|nr:hypothetical protein [Rhodospirillales bacterium]
KNKEWGHYTNEDHSEYTVKFKGGCVATLTISNLAMSPRPRWRILGEQGAIEAGDGKWLVKSVVNGRQMTAEVPFAESNWDAYYKNVYRHLQGRAKLVITPESGARVIGVLGPKLDYVVRTRIHDARKAEIWIRDQYHNPHETWHSIDEVLDWFDESGIDYLNCVPPILDTDGETAPSYITATDPGDRYQRLVTQVSWLGTIAREGALFDMFGRKRSA